MTPRLLLLPVLAQREADGKAIGGGCRHALRGIEECCQLNPKASKTAVFDGWREMDQYMRDNKIEGQPTPAGAQARSNTAMLSTCAVCGNMFTTPAAVQR